MSREADRWQRVRRVFQATLDRPETDRTRFLREVCADDSDLRREVESLLDANATAPERFMGSPAIKDLGASAAGQFIHATTESAVLAAGSSIGPYEIVALLGAGGMGKVYRARDTRLKRDVAIKVLPDLFARDRERLNRFRHEAQLLASLNHPHIAAIYGVEESADHTCLVLELVDGPTLSDLVARAASRSKPSGLPVADALSIAQQIGEALEAAHDKGIVHRDLKPSIDSRDRGLHVTGAGEGSGGGPAQRPLRVRVRPLRNAHRREGIWRRDGHGDVGRGVERRTRLESTARRHAAICPSRAAPLPGKGPQAAPS